MNSNLKIKTPESTSSLVESGVKPTFRDASDHHFRYILFYFMKFPSSIDMITKIIIFYKK